MITDVVFAGPGLPSASLRKTPFGLGFAQGDACGVGRFRPLGR